MNRIRTGLATLVFALAGFFAANAHATVITIDYSGTVTATGPGANVAVGDVFSGSIIYDDEVLDRNSAPDAGIYSFISVSFNIGPFSFLTSSGEIALNNQPGRDELGFTLRFPPGATAGLTIPLVTMSLLAASDDLFVSDALTQLASISIANFGASSVDVVGNPGSFSGQLTRFGDDAVPEPGTMLLLSAGMLGLAIARRRKSNLVKA